MVAIDATSAPHFGFLTSSTFHTCLQPPTPFQVEHEFTRRSIPVAVTFNIMANQQGKPYTKEQKESIIESLRPYLEAGLSRNKACDAIGFDPTTLSVWVKDDSALSMKLKGFENTLNILAMSNIARALQKESEIEDARKETSKWYLERRMKDEFSTRTEATGKDGQPLVVTFDSSFNGGESK